MTNKDSLQPFEKNESINSIGMSQLMDDLQLIINSAKVRVASVANAELTMIIGILVKESTVRFLETNGRSMESRLCRRCRHNYSVSMATRDLRLVASGV